MVDYIAIIDEINDTVYENTSGKVSASGLNNVLRDMVTVVQEVDSGKQDTLTFDTTPLSGSLNPVTSGGIYTALQSATGGSFLAGDNIILDVEDGVTTISTTLSPKLNSISTSDSKLAMTLVSGVDGAGVMFGNGNTIDSLNSGNCYIFGRNNNIEGTGVGNFINGTNNEITGKSFTTIFGTENTVNSDCSLVSGDSNNIEGQYNTAFGNDNEIIDGSFNLISGIGNSIASSGTSNIVNGSTNSITGDNSYANALFGKDNEIVTNNSNYNIVGGTSNVVGGSSSFVCGYDNTTSSSNSFITGSMNTIRSSSNDTVVSGYNNTVSGSNSICTGSYNNVMGSNNATIGNYLYNENTNSVVIGKYNADDSGLFQIGYGTSTSNRKNVMSVSITGKISTSYSTNIADNGTTVATKDYVDSKSLPDLITGVQSTIKPNAYYILGSITSFPTVTTATKVVNKANEYSGRFSVSTVFTLPTQDDNSVAIAWYGSTTLTQGNLYEFSIIEGVGIITELI